MKISKALMAVMFVALFSVPVFAQKGKAVDNNKINVTGDLQKEGHIIIDVDWTVDTSKYSGLTRNEIRRKVRDDIMDKMMPKIMASTKDMNVAYDSSRFTTINETHKLIEKRKDGSRLYSLKLEIEFEATAVPPPPAPTPRDEKGFVLVQRWNNDF